MKLAVTVCIIIIDVVSVSVLANYEQNELSIQNDKSNLVNCLKENGFTRLIENQIIGFGIIDNTFSNYLTTVIKLYEIPSIGYALINNIGENLCKKLHPITELIAKGGMDECKAIIKGCFELFLSRKLKLE
ncbi:uncharacterized protein LOC126905621 isoform X2 [Daktulosphaira vitifoliae]|uniref:uncharacterized protein LOC126905621 isoform X2 n=1 Tax=Daktulosphaira vitifoliae TaxID=58002 RepID=UPI0021A99A65|nr:uncharacterized protein LOC126905621 isoform X2 [Daktulosphaira vitifoliae]